MSTEAPRERRLAVIMAGGLGSRLQPFTNQLPKALVPIGDTPMLFLLLQQLRSQGFSEVVLCLGHMASRIRAYVEKVEANLPGLRILMVEERKPLGTIGALDLLEDLPRSFIVMNCDVLTTLSAADLLRQHSSSNAILTIATTRRSMEIPYGVVVAQDGKLQNFLEKPTEERQVSMGVYALDQRVLEFLVPGAPLQFDDFVHRLLDADVSVRTFQTENLWVDVGTPATYKEANRLYSKQGMSRTRPLQSARKG